MKSLSNKIKLTVQKTSGFGFLNDLKVHIRMLRKSVKISGTIRTNNRLHIHATRSGSFSWKMDSYFLSRSRPGIPWLHTEMPVLFGLINDVIKSSEDFEIIEQLSTTKNVTK